MGNRIDFVQNSSVFFFSDSALRNAKFSDGDSRYYWAEQSAFIHFVDFLDECAGKRYHIDLCLCAASFFCHIKITIYFRLNNYPYFNFMITFHEVKTIIIHVHPFTFRWRQRLYFASVVPPMGPSFYSAFPSKLKQHSTNCINLWPSILNTNLP